MKKIIKPILFGLLALILILSLAAGGFFWYDSHVDRSGWAVKDGVRFYRDFHGRPMSGWLTLDGRRYFLDPYGVPLTGWQNLDGEACHFDSGGILDTGWTELDGQVYYLGENGVPAAGWTEVEGLTYYFDGDGKLFSGWLEDGNSRYYLLGGIPATGWQKFDGNTYYFENSGALVTGEAQVDGTQYCFQDDGSLLTGWNEGHSRFYLPTGAAATGWLELDGKLYCFDEEGLARTGWYSSGEYRWYFYEDGSAAVGPADIDGIRRYFTPKGMEIILVNALNPIPADYDPDLITLSERHRVAAPCYDALVQMMADCEEAGNEIDFNSAYRTQAVQEAILEDYTEDYMAYYDIDYEEAEEMVLTFVAYPGTSEHQLGLAVDLLGSDAVTWLNEHCWDYGFIRRYTKEKESVTGIVSEPWHFRYVGREVALDLKDSGLCLEEYLGAEAVKG